MLPSAVTRRGVGGTADLNNHRWTQILNWRESAETTERDGETGKGEGAGFSYGTLAPSQHEARRPGNSQPIFTGLTCSRDAI